MSGILVKNVVCTSRFQNPRKKRSPWLPICRFPRKKRHLKISSPHFHPGPSELIFESSMCRFLRGFGTIPFQSPRILRTFWTTKIQNHVFSRSFFHAFHSRHVFCDVFCIKCSKTSFFAVKMALWPRECWPTGGHARGVFGLKQSKKTWFWIFNFQNVRKKQGFSSGVAPKPRKKRHFEYSKIDPV